jgi:tRNA (guanine-N7-)-methyltransferase
MLIKPEFNPKAIRSFVIRAGRMTEGQKSAFDTWWPLYGVSLFAGIFDGATQFNNANPLVVEMGFGMGDSLFAMASAAPDTNFVGIEVHPPGVGRLINTAGKASVNNLKVYMADATDVLRDCFADNSIDRFQLYFPDPWHKKKHHKRRVVQLAFLQLVQQKLKSGGVLHMATDWQAYAEYMLEMLQQSEGWKNLGEPSGYAKRPDYRPITKFEKRGENLGHGVWDLLMAKTENCI